MLTVVHHEIKKTITEYPKGVDYSAGPVRIPLFVRFRGAAAFTEGITL